MLPGVPKELKNADIDDGELGRVEAIICSMTAEEREHPSIINGSRRIRIARGSGTTTSEVNAVLKQFKMVQQMMKSMTRGGKGGKGKRRMAMPDLDALTRAMGPGGGPALGPGPE